MLFGTSEDSERLSMFLENPVFYKRHSYAQHALNKIRARIPIDYPSQFKH